MSVENMILETHREKFPEITLNDKTQFLFDEDLRCDFDSIPDRLAFKIGDVVKITAIKTYVLRYWEGEFKNLSPQKSKKNQRVYTRRDIELVFLIKKLLYRDKYSIQGAQEVLKNYCRKGKGKFETRSVHHHMSDLQSRIEGIYSKLKILENRFSHEEE